MSKIGVADVLRAGAILATIVMIAAFFSGCVTEQLDSEGHVIRKRQADHEFHGEMGDFLRSQRLTVTTGFCPTRSIPVRTSHSDVATSQDQIQIPELVPEIFSRNRFLIRRANFVRRQKRT
jgi:hypothetical protein